jgi:hypothetical protein
MSEAVPVYQINIDIDHRMNKAVVRKRLKEVIATQCASHEEPPTEERIEEMVDSILKIPELYKKIVHGDESLETDTAVYNKESKIERSCSDGYFRSKVRKADNEQVNSELVNTPSEKQTSAFSLSSATITRFKSLYAKFPDQINYRIRFGSAMERAQSLVIKNVAMGAVAVE